MSGHVFLSHSSADRDEAERLVADIEQRGINCWISSRDIHPGEDYQSAIVQALSSSAIMLLLFSTNANKSKEIAKELALASAKGKIVIPARIEDILPTGAFEYQITNAQFIDLFRNYNAALDRLCAALRRQLALEDGGLPAPAPSPPMSSPPVEPRLVPGARRRSGSSIWLASTALVLVLLAGAAVWGLRPASHKPSVVAMSTSAPRPVPVQTQAPALIVPAARAPIAPPSAAPVPQQVPPAAIVPGSFGPMPTPGPAPGPIHPDGRQAPEDVVRALEAIPTAQREARAAPLLNGLSQPLTAMQAQSVLQGLSSGARISLLRTLLGAIRPGITADEGADLLAGANESRFDGLVALQPVLGKPQEVAGLTKLLSGLGPFQRIRGIHVLEPVLPASLSSADMTGLLDGTADARLDGLRALEPRLAMGLGADDALSILQGSGYRNRVDALRLIARHLKPGLGADDAADLLRGTNDNWLDGLTALLPVLAKPQDGPGLAKLLGSTSYAGRVRGFHLLAQLMPDTLSAADVAELLHGTNESQLDGLRVLAPRLAKGLSASDALPLLDGLAYRNRVDALGMLVPHLQPGITADDGAGLLRGTNDFWISGLQALVPVLARPQDGPGLRALLDSTAYANRVKALQLLVPLMPQSLSASDGVDLLRGCNDARPDGIRVLASRLRIDNAAERDDVLAGVPESMKSALRSQLR